MSSSKDLFNKIQKLYTTNPDGLNIIEEQIDLELQFNYFKRSNMLKKQVVALDDVMNRIPTLYDPEARIEEKRDILVYLASFEEVDSFRAIEKFKNESVGEIKLWATMAYRESKMLLASSFLDEDQILISTGLGGRGAMLRYFVVLVQRNEQPFTEIQQKVIRSEFDFSTKRNNSELESVTFENHIVKTYVLIPLNVAVKNIVDEVIEACTELGNFINERVIVTNVRALDNEEIMEIVHGKLNEEEILGIDDMNMPYNSMNYDDDYDDFDEDENEDDDED